MNIDISTFPAITAVTAGCILLLQMVLMVHVGRVRGQTEAVFGPGNETTQQAIRAHGNLAENAGILIIGLALLEMAGAATWAMASLGGVLVVARVAHAIGLLQSTGVHPGRVAGAVGTLLVGVVTAIYLLVLAVPEAF